MSKFKDNKSRRPRQSMKNIKEIPRIEHKSKKIGNHQLNEIENDNTLTSNLHEHVHQIRSLKEAMDKESKGAIKYDNIFEKIPITDEILKLSDDKRKSEIYNGLLKFFLELYSEMSTDEKKDFFKKFPEMFEWMRSKIGENLKENAECAKFFLRGTHTREDMEYLYKLSHKNSKEGYDGGYFSESKPLLNDQIVNGLLNIGQYNLGSDDNFAMGYSDIKKEGEYEDLGGNNSYASGIFKRTWRSYFQGYTNKEKDKIEKANIINKMGPEIHQNFLFDRKYFDNLRKEEEKK